MVLLCICFCALLFVGMPRLIIVFYILFIELYNLSILLSFLQTGISLIEVGYQWDFKKSPIISLIQQQAPHISISTLVTNQQR